MMIVKPTMGRGLALAALFVAGVTAAPATARDNGAAIGLGILGGAVAGAAIASTPNPYNNPYYYAPPAPAYYYPPAPAYYPPRNCWNAYYQQYYAC